MPDWITIAEAVELSRYNPVYLRRLMQAGKIKGRKFGPLWQVSKASLAAYLKVAEQSEDKRHGPKKTD